MRLPVTESTECCADIVIPIGSRPEMGTHRSEHAAAFPTRSDLDHGPYRRGVFRFRNEIFRPPDGGNGFGAAGDEEMTRLLDNFLE